MEARTVSHYKIVSKLGEGGMGVVYRAEDLILRRPVALKFPPPYSLADPQVKSRFEREAQVLAGLNHPNICTIYEIGEADGLPFIAMELVEGRELKAIIRERPLPLEQALDIVMQACEGLKAAHDRGALHRDIKPSNLMVTGEGRVKVLDFGLAKIADRSQLTKTGKTLGTPAYMAPEQALAQAMDRRSDIWSLGVVLYETIAGQLPFRGEVEAAIAYAIVHTQPEPPTALRSGVPIELDRIVEKALAKDPQERYQHIDSLAADLRGVRQGRAVRPIGRRIRPPSRRALIGAAAVATAAAVAAIWFTNAPATIGALAVLPLANDSAVGQEAQYLSDGVAQGVIAQLSRSPGLRVLSWDGVSHYEGADRDAQTIARELGVDAVLKGRLEQRGETVVIRTELIDAADGSVLWGEQYSRSLSELLDVENDISRAVGARLGLAPAPTVESASQGTLDPEAYRLYLRGRYYWDQRGQSLTRSRDYFQQAVDLDPTYGLAWAGLTDAYLMLGGWHLMSPADAGPRAEAAAKQAIEIDPTLAEPHATLGYLETLWGWDWPSAEAEFRRAVELNPAYPTAHHWFAFYWLTLGNESEAVAEIEKARALSPLSPVINAEVAYFYSYARDYSRAEQEAARAIELDPTFHSTQRILCRVYALQGKRQELDDSIEKSLEFSNRGPGNLMMRAAALGWVGELVRGRELLEETFRRYRGISVHPAWVALAYANLEGVDRAFEYYNTSIDERSIVPSWLRDPLLDRIADDPRYGEHFVRLGLQP